LVSLTSIPGKLMEQLILETTSTYMKKRWSGVVGTDSQKGKSYFHNPKTFCDEMTALVDEEREMDIVYLDFSKTFDTVFHNILIGKLYKCGLNEQTVM